MNDQERYVLNVAIALILIGLISMGIADHFNWRDLAGAAGIVLGYGGGILQGKSNGNHEQKTNAGDIINSVPKP